MVPFVNAAKQHFSVEAAPMCGPSGFMFKTDWMEVGRRSILGPETGIEGFFQFPEPVSLSLG